MKFVKILRKDEIHQNFSYQEGYNTEVNFNVNCYKGLYFTEWNAIKYWFHRGDFDGHYREVITFVNGKKNDHAYKAKTIFIGPKKKFTEKIKIKVLQECGLNINYIKNPSEKVQLEAVKNNYYSIKYIDNPSEQVKIASIESDPAFILGSTKILQ